MDIYLDVETDWSRRLTVVGFYALGNGLVQLVGPQITPANLEATLPALGSLYTFNGHCFDLPLLRQQMGLNLRQRYNCVDLMHACRRHGLRGGQKAIEDRLGICRRLPGLSGRDAVLLWQRFQSGDRRALVTLLQYNGEDLVGMMKIKNHLERPAADVVET